MEQNNVIFDFDDKTKNNLNAKMVVALFKILYSQNKISKREFESLISNLNRTFNLKEEVC